MAERRMFAKTIIDSDAFLEMPQSTQNLYFHLSMRADDDGFINNPKRIERMIGASDDDLKILCAKSFIIPFDSGIVVIKHWKIHNYIRNDRYKPTVYTEEVKKLDIKPNGAYTVKRLGIPSDNQNGYQMDTQVRLGEVSVGKESIIEESTVPASPSPPSTDSSADSTLFGESDNAQKKIKDTVPPAKVLPDEAIRLAHLLADLHRDLTDAKFHPKDSAILTWAGDIDKLNRIDGREWGEIEGVIRWVQTPGCFWNPNILSGKTLREKFDRLVAQMKQGGGVKTEMRNAALGPGIDF